ncbi:g1896 [Coccomyxa elongata]
MLKGGGGTATATHLLANTLREQDFVDVTFLGVTKEIDVCTQAQKVHKASGLNFECLQMRHFEQPRVVETYPYEALSHAVVAWLREHADLCEVIHGHEWGGVLVDAATVAYFRRLVPGTRTVIVPHGGHMWSLQWKPHRSLSVEPLRIDHQERMVNMLADTLASPTQHMRAYLRARGWRLPTDTRVIPNVMPALVAEPRQEAPGGLDTGHVKRVWRLAFFSRMEERKGVKVFVDALHLLDAARLKQSQEANSKWWRGMLSAEGTAEVLGGAAGIGEQDKNMSRRSLKATVGPKEELEVFFMGGDTYVQSQPSSTWLEEQAARWPWKAHLLMNAPRAEALAVLAQPGMLVVFCSLVENLPYVVAEVGAMGVPYMVADVGGMSELVDLGAFSEAVLAEASAPRLAAQLQTVLERGTLPLLPLRPQALTGAKQWVNWQRSFAAERASFVKADRAMASLAKSRGPAVVQVVGVPRGEGLAQVWQAACGGKGAGDLAAPLLLLPDGFSLLPGDEILQVMAGLLAVAEARGGRIGALTFGVELPSGEHAFPSSPTWLLHAGGDPPKRCYGGAPLLLRGSTFCRVAEPRARVVKTYSIWALSMLLGHDSLHLHTYPQSFFRVGEWDAGAGYEPCVATRLPEQLRAEMGQAAAILYRDAEQTLWDMQIGHYGRPLASLNADYPMYQRHLGWTFGYFTEASSTKLEELVWRQDEGKWGCADAAYEFPSMRPGGMHPCASEEGHCCGNSTYAAAAVRFTALFRAVGARVMLAYDVYPFCGDGIDLVVSHNFYDLSRPPAVLMAQAYEMRPEAESKSNRRRVEWVRDIEAGDTFDFVLHPRRTHACDGMSLIDLVIWPAAPSAA